MFTNVENMKNCKLLLKSTLPTFIDKYTFKMSEFNDTKKSHYDLAILIHNDVYAQAHTHSLYVCVCIYKLISLNV